MERNVKCGLIQASCPISGKENVDKIKQVMIEKHTRMIEKAGSEGVQILCLQELFNGPYFPAEENPKWYEMAEKVPEGHTITVMRELAKRYKMVIIVPIYEEELTSVYYNTAAVIDAEGQYLGKYRKNHIPHILYGFEKFYFKPGNLGYPSFKTAFATIGVYICADRHFPEGARILGLNGSEIVFNPSATKTELSKCAWKLELPAHAVFNGYFVGGINRVGHEDPWDGEFYGTSFFCDPGGQIIVEATRSKDQLLIADLDLNKIGDIRKQRQFLRDRRPETYADLCRLLP